MNKWVELKKYGWILIIAVIALIGGIYFFMPNKEKLPAWEDVQMTESEIEDTSSDVVEEVSLMVDIKGEVKKPGVYELAEGARVKEVVLLAGGFTENAEERQLNLAERLTDQQMIYVPNKEEVAESLVPTVNEQSKESSSNELVNINTADLTELQKLSGIGASKAQAIIDYREENGNFKTTTELTNVSGIGEKTLEKLEDEITI